MVQEYSRPLLAEVKDVAKTRPSEAGDFHLQGEAELLVQHGQLLQQVVLADGDFLIREIIQAWWPVAV